ncbi:Hypothetical predicted protein [Lecanosticta acicola]|uniref:Uncharacterized protein n=1 Tax=Lecanosticta acicola TaxID=111012 RepID=A0AAI9E9R7_9PEZI|nr:Hypothetical predicted protein [Lecanosticta acicola]
MGWSKKTGGRVGQKLSAMPKRSAASKPQLEELQTLHNKSVEDEKEDESIEEVEAEREAKQVGIKDQKKEGLEAVQAPVVQPRKDSGLADEHVETSSNTIDDGFSLVENKKPKQNRKQGWLLEIMREPEPRSDPRATSTWGKVTRVATTAITQRLRVHFAAKTESASRIPQCIYVRELQRGIPLYHYVVSEYDGPRPPPAQVFQGQGGRWYLEKPRITALLNIYAFHADEAYFYTFNGVGLNHQPADIQQEHVGIRPLGVAPSEWKKNFRQNDHKPLVVKSMREASFHINPISTCHFTGTHPFKFDRRARILGELETSSMNELDALRRNSRHR